ncbi:hypothetical protein SDC9_69955 [bioreactor metagenome]|uniref:FeS cluster biogenesis domain-containing protein n=1 Tax=bioreactor metagenome TaxID=1076179 RepID=A0A644Y6B9_9ZZZZ
MKITDEAKVLLAEALIANNCDCLQVTLQQSCCGTSLNFDLAKLNTDDESVLVNGVSVLMDNETQKRAETVTLAAENGELVIEDDAPSCCC